MFPYQMLAFFQAEDGGNFMVTMGVPFLAMIALMYFLLIKPQMKQEKDHRKMIDNLKKGDKVITKGGIWGEIDSVEPQFFRLKVNEKNKIVVSRSAVSGVQPMAGKEESK